MLTTHTEHLGNDGFHPLSLFKRLCCHPSNLSLLTHGEASELSCLRVDFGAAAVPASFFTVDRGIEAAANDAKGRAVTAAQVWRLRRQLGVHRSQATSKRELPCRCWPAEQSTAELFVQSGSFNLRAPNESGAGRTVINGACSHLVSYGRQSVLFGIHASAS